MASYPPQDFGGGSEHGRERDGSPSTSASGKGNDKKGESSATDKGSERKGVINRVNRMCFSVACLLPLAWLTLSLEPQRQWTMGTHR
jgi:hypothetical protein